MKEISNCNPQMRNFGCSTIPSAPYFRATANIWPKPKSWQERNASILQEFTTLARKRIQIKERYLLQVMAHLGPGRMLLSFNFRSMLFYDLDIQMFCPEIHSKFVETVH